MLFVNDQKLQFIYNSLGLVFSGELLVMVDIGFVLWFGVQYSIKLQ